MIHGGDIYKNKIELDFSVNTNPLSCPVEVREAAINAMDRVDSYPEYDYESLRRAISLVEGYDYQGIVVANGASEIFMAIANALMPKRAVLFAPSFYGYEHCLRAVDCQIDFIELDISKLELAAHSGDLFSENTDICFIGNPNNPTGKYLDDNLLDGILAKSKEKGITLVLDECFFDLGLKGKKRDYNSLFDQYPNVIITKAFTKLFAVAGLRIGYGLASKPMIDKISKRLPEWNVSIVADAAGKACCRLLMEGDFLVKTHILLAEEKDFLTSQLRSLGFMVFESDCNFLLLKTEKKLKEDLLKEGLLIRDCSNFRGLSEGYYRIAVKDRKSNERLIELIRGIYND